MWNPLQSFFTYYQYFITDYGGDGRKQVMQPSAVLYVKNFSSTTTESDLMEVFDGCIRAKIIFDQKTGQSKR